MRDKVRQGTPSVLALIALIAASLLLLAAVAPATAPAADAAAKQGKKKHKKKKKYKGPKIATPNSSRCDFLDTSVCLQPFPNNLYTVRDKGTDSGRRINFNVNSLPANAAGEPWDPTDHNRNDGFSPGQAIVVHIPGLDNQAAFDKTGIVGLADPSAYRDKKQPVVVIDAKTRKRHPIFAEMDANPASDAERNLIIRPEVNWEEGHRYIVALRKLKTASGKKIKAPNAFRVYRDKLITKQRAVEKRRNRFEKRIFKPIRKTKRLGRKHLYTAWDFTVASGRSLSERVLAMRDQAFAELGDTNLADMQVQGDSPDFTITNVIDNPNAEVLRRIEGTIDVPCFLDTDGCGPGAKFMYDSPDATMPTFNPSYRVDVPFECNIPSSVDDGSGHVVEARPTMYGHGLLGSKSQAHSGSIRDFGENHNMLLCAVDWAGFSEEDLLPVIVPSLSNLTNMSAAFDRMQQGFVNFMLLGRALIHPQGLTTDPAFSVDVGSGPEPVINTDRLYYYGNSQGGIMGGALTALEPDLDRSVLGVPGMNYSTLLRRSVDFDQYAELPNLGLYDNYPNELERPLVLGLMQMLWDRGEANGYAWHMTKDPYENTPQHSVLLHAAVGDHQVSNITAEVEARTIGAKVLQPALDPGRHWQQNPFFRLPPIGKFPYTDSALVYWDGGPAGVAGDVGGGSGVIPLENVPPRPENGFGDDPHEYPRRAPDAQLQMSRWLMPNGAIQAACPSNDPCYSNGYEGP